MAIIETPEARNKAGSFRGGKDIWPREPYLLGEIRAHARRTHKALDGSYEIVGAVLSSPAQAAPEEDLRLSRDTCFGVYIVVV